MAEVNELVKTYAEAHGLELCEGARGSFSDTDLTLNKLTLKLSGSSSMDERHNNAALQNALRVFGLSTDVRNGKQIVRYDQRKHKYPVIYKSTADGKLYKCSIEEAQLRFSA